MFGSKMMKVVSLVLGLMLLMSSVAFAGTDETKGKNALQAAQIDKAESDDSLIQKQGEIDRYFAEHEKELGQRGIRMSYTGVDSTNTYVEIGILEYSGEKADYLYQLFGRDRVKVVKGEAISLLASTSDVSKTTSSDESLSEKKTAAQFGERIAVFFQNIWKWIKNLIGL